jgi:hypothetical protein
MSHSVKEAFRFERCMSRQPTSEAEERALIDSFVEAAWRRFPAYHAIQDDSSQRKALAGLCSVHKFPGAAEVLGTPEPRHYSPVGGLVTARKAQFLLLGVFEWRGIRITYQHHFPVRRAHAGRWLAATETTDAADLPPFDTLRDFVYPSRRYVWRPFKDVAAELGLVAPQRMRKPQVLECAVCLAPTIGKNSVRRKYHSQWLRLCLELTRFRG